MIIERSRDEKNISSGRFQKISCNSVRIDIQGYCVKIQPKYSRKQMLFERSPEFISGVASSFVLEDEVRILAMSLKP